MGEEVGLGREDRGDGLDGSQGVSPAVGVHRRVVDGLPLGGPVVHGHAGGDECRDLARTRFVDAHQIEEVGEKLRGMMPWISAGKMVDKSRN